MRSETLVQILCPLHIVFLHVGQIATKLSNIWNLGKNELGPQLEKLNKLKLKHFFACYFETTKEQKGFLTKRKFFQ